MRIRHYAAILPLLLLAGGVGDLEAQTVQVPTFSVASGSPTTVDVAGDYGGMHFVTSDPPRRSAASPRRGSPADRPSSQGRCRSRSSQRTAAAA